MESLLSCCSFGLCSGLKDSRYFAHDDSRSGIGSCGRLSCAANVIPGRDMPFLCEANGLRSLEVYDSVESLAAWLDRSFCGVPGCGGMSFLRDNASFWSREDGLVNDLMAMATVIRQLTKDGGNEGGKRQQPQSAAEEIMTVLEAVHRHWVVVVWKPCQVCAKWQTREGYKRRGHKSGS
jgi:hypothetical protein